MSPLGYKTAVLSICAGVACAYVNEPVAAPPEKLDGLYEVDFSINQANELALDAHITDLAQNPAPDGVVVFYYCSFKGVPRFDITNPDEAPSSACADGSGKWVRLAARSSQ
jgi:hypothetical protein